MRIALQTKAPKSPPPSPRPPVPQRVQAAQPKVEMTTMVMDITPAQAEEFLRLNCTNRDIRPSWVAMLQKMIERGEWKLTHQGIAITNDNRLLDGQHRLRAIVAAGVTVQMNVSFDCDPDTFVVLDGGVKRTAADHLKVSVGTAALARMLFRLLARPDRTPPTSTQLAEVLSWSKEVIDEVAAMCGKKNGRSSIGIQMALCAHLMADRPDVKPAFIAFHAAEFDDMPASLKALTRQIMDGKTSATKDAWELSARAWRAMDPQAHDEPVQLGAVLRAHCPLGVKVHMGEVRSLCGS